MNANWNTVKIGQSQLITHTGAKSASWKDVCAISTPNPTKSWTPISHEQVIGQVQETLGRTGLDIQETAYALFNEGQRFFGLLGLNVKGGDGGSAYQLVVGLRNSHDKSFPVGIVVGSRVFVCDNLAFSSEIQVTRRHTVNLRNDLPRLIATACGKIHDSAETQERRFCHYRDHDLTDAQVHDVLVQSLDIDAIGSTALPKVLQEWREPSHVEFAQDHTAWRLWNAYTEVFKQYAVNDLPKRSIALQGLMDVFTKFQLAVAA